jgi:hypothetical protein
MAFGGNRNSEGIRRNLEELLIKRNLYVRNWVNSCKNMAENRNFLTPATRDDKNEDMRNNKAYYANAKIN